MRATSAVLFPESISRIVATFISREYCCRGISIALSIQCNWPLIFVSHFGGALHCCRPFPLHPKSPPKLLRFAPEPTLQSILPDEAEHFYAQSTRQRRFAPTAVRLRRNTVRLPAGISVHLHRNNHYTSKTREEIVSDIENRLAAAKQHKAWMTALK